MSLWSAICFFPIVDIKFRCTDRPMFGQSSKSVPKEFLSPARGVNARRSSDQEQIFQIAVIGDMCPSLVEIRSVTSEIRRRKKKKPQW